MIQHVTSLILAVTCALTARVVDIMPAEVRSLATGACIFGFPIMDNMRDRFSHFTETQPFKFLPAEVK